MARGLMLLAWIEQDTGQAPLHLLQALQKQSAKNKTISPCLAHNSHLPLPLPASTEQWSGPPERPQIQKDREGGATRSTLHFLPIHKDPSAMMGSTKLMETTPVHLELLCTRNLSFQVHITISKSDTQCSQTVHL